MVKFINSHLLRIEDKDEIMLIDVRNVVAICFDGETEITFHIIKDSIEQDYVLDYEKGNNNPYGEMNAKFDLNKIMELLANNTD